MKAFIWISIVYFASIPWYYIAVRKAFNTLNKKDQDEVMPEGLYNREAVFKMVAYLPIVNTLLALYFTYLVIWNAILEWKYKRLEARERRQDLKREEAIRDAKKIMLKYQQNRPEVYEAIKNAIDAIERENPPHE